MRMLITGSEGFTGKHLVSAAKKIGYEVFPLKSNLTDFDAVLSEVKSFSPTHVCHLAGISALTHQNEFEYYSVNLFGTLNLLKALNFQREKVKKILITSSANVYGNQDLIKINEQAHPCPINHYSMSKLSMELMARTYLNNLPIIIVRPFNYTGAGQSKSFLIPKIIHHFLNDKKEIELGNLDVIREYNDVRMICDIYLKLLKTSKNGEVYNICTGIAYTLKDIIDVIEKLSKRVIAIKVNPDFIRENEVKSLIGDPSKLRSIVGSFKEYDISETIAWMMDESCQS